MSAYIARRIFLMIPTLLGILFVSFVVVQFAPGGPPGPAPAAYGPCAPNVTAGRRLVTIARRTS